MALKMCLIASVIVSICIGQSLAEGWSMGKCSQRNISCGDIKTPYGFKFKHGCPQDSEVEILADDKTVLANVRLGSQDSLVHFSEVRIDNDSVTIKHCQNLRVNCVINGKNNTVHETCEDIKMTNETENSDSPDPQGFILPVPVPVSVLIVAIVIVIGFGILCWCYMSWRKEMKRQNCATTPSGFFRYLLRKGISLFEKGEREETRPHGGTELQEVTAGDTEAQHSRNVHPSDGDPRGSGDEETGEENTPGRMSVHRDDPGGANSNERKDTLRKMAGGDHNAEDRETEGRQLLPNQRAAIQDFDMIGEDTALVNKPGFDPDQVGGCSAAPETDVESTRNMENY